MKDSKDKKIKMSIWVGNFLSYEKLYKYKTKVFVDEDIVEYPQMYYDFQTSLFNDLDMFETYYTQAYEDIWDIIKAQMGDYQIFKQFKVNNGTTNLGGKYNSIIIYLEYDYIEEQKETKKEVITEISENDYNVKFIGCFEYDAYDARLKYPITESKYRDEKLKEELSDDEYQELLERMKKENSTFFGIKYDKDKN